jgi:uncharacterized protein YbjQ (UPF0145 family)
MKLDVETQKKLDNLGEATFCITLGTIAGLLTYEFCLMIHLDIFGWNLGLAFSPLVAGYVETYLAQRYMKESTGAVSAFILFLVTVVYGFLIANPTLGFNAITIGSIFIILQAALPTLINYFIIIFILAIISYISGIFKRVTAFFYKIWIKIKSKITGKEYPLNLPFMTPNNFDETLKMDINDLGVLLLSTTHLWDQEVIKYNGVYEGKIIYKAKHPMGFEKNEDFLLNDLKKVKDQAIFNLCESAKNDGCNGILDLTIEYDVLDGNGTVCHVTAHGTGVVMKKSDTWS